MASVKSRGKSERKLRVICHPNVVTVDYRFRPPTDPKHFAPSDCWRLLVAYSHNSLNQYGSVGVETFSYDDNFNLTSTGPHGFHGIYDAANHLVSAFHTGGSQPVLAEFVYDGLGRCVKRTIGGVATLFAYDGWKPIAEWNEWNHFQAWNVYGPGPDEILLRHEVRYGYLRFHTDRHGNVAFLLDNDGRVVEKYTYDAFGLPTITGAGGDLRDFSYLNHCFLFQGPEYIQGLGIYDYRNRFYHPGLGRFLQVDPIGLQTSGKKLSAEQAAFYPAGEAPESFTASEVNLYRFCQDDPINSADPMGLTWRSNLKFLARWIFGGGPRQEQYKEDSVQTREMANSPGAKTLKDTFNKGNGKDVKTHAYGTGRAYKDTVINPETADLVSDWRSSGWLWRRDRKE